MYTLGFFTSVQGIHYKYNINEHNMNVHTRIFIQEYKEHFINTDNCCIYHLNGLNSQ